MGRESINRFLPVHIQHLAKPQQERHWLRCGQRSDLEKDTRVVQINEGKTERRESCLGRVKENNIKDEFSLQF